MWVVEGTGDISPDQAAQPHAARGVTTNVNGASLQFDEYGSGVLPEPRSSPRKTMLYQMWYYEDSLSMRKIKTQQYKIKFAQFILNRAALGLVKGFGLTVQIIATCDAAN
jgi:hypothetical protein